MSRKLIYQTQPAAAFPDWTFVNLDVAYDRATQSVWMYYKADGPPFYTFQTLIDMIGFRESLRGLFMSDARADYPIRYFVMASRKPGIFNLGGDLMNFADAAESRDRSFLTDYAHACIDIVYGLVTAYGLPIVTLSVLAGQALGGGLEGALAEDFVFAEETARLGVPEVGFNTFPGMGAVTLLSRRLGLARAEQIIASGKVYTGRELFDMGAVDHLVADGTGQEAARAWMLKEGEDGFTRRLALTSERRRAFPIYYEDLLGITDIWVETAAQVTPADIRHMRRLATAQKRFLRG